MGRHPGMVFFLSLAWIPLLNSSPMGDLSHWYSDHIHHSFATWVALKKGTAIYTQPFSAIWTDTGWPYPVNAWGNMPGFAYPPGVAMIFLPLVAIGKTQLLSMHGFGVLSILMMLAFAGLAFHNIVRLLEMGTGEGRMAIGILAGLLLAHIGLQGFYDSTFVACGALMIMALKKERPDRALLWFGVAMLLHYRAVVLAPLGLLSWLNATRGIEPRAWPWRPLSFVLGSAVIALWTFLLMYPTTAPFRAQAVRVLNTPNAQLLIVAVSFLLAILLVAFHEYLALGTLATVFILTEVEVQNYWWHGIIIVFVPLTIGLHKNAILHRLGLLRAAALVWCLVVHPVVWRDHPGVVFTEFVKLFHH